MDLEVKNLDLGYDQCSGISRLSINKGQSLMTSLEENIKNLKLHWVGTDATMHINNLIFVYENLRVLIEISVKGVANAADQIINMQRVRNANGGGGRVDSSLPKTITDFASIAKVETTDSYYADPALSSDLSQLTNICQEFNSFKEDFKVNKEELFANWLRGANRENVLNNFEQFIQSSDNYEKYLNEAKDNLSTAVSNINQL